MLPEIKQLTGNEGALEKVWPVEELVPRQDGNIPKVVRIPSGG